jgi:hypothetical protein
VSWWFRLLGNTRVLHTGDAATATVDPLEVEQQYIEEYCARLEEESRRLSQRIQSVAAQGSSLKSTSNPPSPHRPDSHAHGGRTQTASTRCSNPKPYINLISNSPDSHGHADGPRRAIPLGGMRPTPSRWGSAGSEGTSSFGRHPSGGGVCAAVAAGGRAAAGSHSESSTDWEGVSVGGGRDTDGERGRVTSSRSALPSRIPRLSFIGQAELLRVLKAVNKGATTAQVHSFRLQVERDMCQ